MPDGLLDIFEDVSEEYETKKKPAAEPEDEWAVFYVEALLSSKGFLDLATGTPDRLQLIKLLLKLDSEYMSERKGRSWEEHVSAGLLDFLL